MHKGLCKTAEIPLNETHRFLRHYCECTEVNDILFC